ncbi:hypothetical protein N7501_001125 [Penicillium viridicatum]|nr:hypothetical protein N7501_001125 [Penicillium viridicatum]
MEYGKCIYNGLRTEDVLLLSKFQGLACLALSGRHVVVFPWHKALGTLNQHTILPFLWIQYSVVFPISQDMD